MATLLRAAELALRPTSRAFHAALEHPWRSQEMVLERIARHAAASEYGRMLHVQSADDFRRRVPVVDYDALAPWLEKQRATEQRVLTDEPVLFYEKTSGSSGAAKLIPYTRSLKRSFSRMFAIWASDLVRHGPRLSRARLYFSVSPAFASGGTTEQGRPIGMQDDRDYLEGWLRHLVSPFLVDGTHAARASDAESFKWATALCLLGEPELEVISIWNPSFLQVHLAFIREHRSELLRASRLSGMRARALDEDEIDWSRVWPRLKLISCWASGAAQLQARALAASFPKVQVQGKGLLCTEAPITVPLCHAPGPVPLVDEVYLELEDDAGVLHPLEHAVEGAEYGLVVSQLGGLYRYRVGDRVRVGPRYRNTKTLELLGRAGGVSDLVGEKLNERFVQGVLESLSAQLSDFATLVPVREPEDRYALVLGRAPHEPRKLAEELDRRLRAAHHYRHARELGQLSAPLVCAGADAAEAVTALYQRRGLKWGDIKHRALHSDVADPALRAWIGRNLA